MDIVDPAGNSVGRGLTNYDNIHVERIRGKKSADVRALLAEAAYDEVIHRDNLVLNGRRATDETTTPSSV